MWVHFFHLTESWVCPYSRIGCYVTVFQNVSNLRDVFYKEMSVVGPVYSPALMNGVRKVRFVLMIPFVLKLNHELYNVMKKLETQHSGKAFIIKGLNR